MKTRNTLLTALVLVIAPALATAQSWSDVVSQARALDYDGSRGVATGEVGDGFESFAFESPDSGPITFEVSVTAIREGLRYEDDDSILALFTADGYLIEQNDDGPYGYQSMIDGTLLPGPGTYYLVVTTHPRFVITDSRGYFSGFEEPGLSSIAFDLIAQAGAAETVEDYEDGDFSAEIVFSLSDIFESAEPVEYAGEPVRFSGRVSSGVAVFQVIAPDYDSADFEVEVIDSMHGGDSVLTIMDEDGNLIAWDDDGGTGSASMVEDVSLANGAVYYVVVSSYPNSPVPDANGAVQGFPNETGDEFDFNLLVLPSGISDSSLMDPM